MSGASTSRRGASRGFGELPPELLERVLCSGLSAEDVLRFSRVSRRCHETVHSCAGCWRHLYVQTFESPDVAPVVDTSGRWPSSAELDKRHGDFKQAFRERCGLCASLPSLSQCPHPGSRAEGSTVARSPPAYGQASGSPAIQRCQTPPALPGTVACITGRQLVWCRPATAAVFHWLLAAVPCSLLLFCRFTAHAIVTRTRRRLRLGILQSRVHNTRGLLSQLTDELQRQQEQVARLRNELRAVQAFR